MNDVRLKLTENEKLAQSMGDNILTSINMGENNIGDLLERERANRFNSELDQYVEEFKEHNKALEEIGNNMGADPAKLEIKPLTDHVLIKPYK